ncbi:hypothetical protein MBLNU230_g1461t1 [Neophaeotheca triangularis]
MPSPLRLLTAITLAFSVATQVANTQSTAPTSTTSPSESQTIVSLFLPLGAAKNLGASIITAAPHLTAYAIGCIPSASASDNSGTTTHSFDLEACGFRDSITLTEGVSTLIYTYNPHVSGLSIEGTTLTPPPAESSDPALATVNCSFAGASSEPSFKPASRAVCTGRSAIHGLGNVASTTTLASTQIEYVPVTVTAGLEKVAAMSAGAGGGGEEGEGEGEGEGGSSGGTRGWEGQGVWSAGVLGAVAGVVGLLGGLL